MPYKDPDKRRACDTARKRLSRGGRPPLIRPANVATSPGARSDEAAKLMAVLWEQIDKARDEKIAPIDAKVVFQRCNTVCSAVSVALRAVETHQMAERLAALERALARQTEDPE